MFKMQTNRY